MMRVQQNVPHKLTVINMGTKDEGYIYQVGVCALERMTQRRTCRVLYCIYLIQRELSA